MPQRTLVIPNLIATHFFFLLFFRMQLKTKSTTYVQRQMGESTMQVQYPMIIVHFKVGVGLIVMRLKLGYKMSHLGLSLYRVHPVYKQPNIQ